MVSDGIAIGAAGALRGKGRDLVHLNVPSPGGASEGPLTSHTAASLPFLSPVSRLVRQDSYTSGETSISSPMNYGYAHEAPTQGAFDDVVTPRNLTSRFRATPPKELPHKRLLRGCRESLSSAPPSIRDVSCAALRRDSFVFYCVHASVCSLSHGYAGQLLATHAFSRKCLLGRRGFCEEQFQALQSDTNDGSSTRNSRASPTPPILGHKHCQQS